jgi:hypothetical protein
VGHNCYGYDNCVLKPNCSLKYASMIDEIAGSYRKRAQWSFVVNIPGTYNGDMFAFAKKTKRWKYEGMSLRAVAKKHGFLKMGGRVTRAL